MTTEIGLHTPHSHDVKVLTCLVSYLEDHRGDLKTAPTLTGLLIGLLVLYLGIASAGSSVPAWLHKGFLGGTNSGWAAGGVIAAVVVLVAADFLIYSFIYHKRHESRLATFKSKLEAIGIPHPSSNPRRSSDSADVSGWTAFLQTRLDRLSSSIQSLAALAGLVPAVTLIQTIPPLHATLATAIGATLLSGILSATIVWSFGALLRRREATALLQAMIVGRLLSENESILIAFLVVASDAQSPEPNPERAPEHKVGTEQST